MKKIAIFMILLVAISCSNIVNSPEPVTTIDWVKKSKDESTKVTHNEAQLFIIHFFSTLDKVIFNPKVLKQERLNAEKTILSSLPKAGSSKRELLKILNKELKKLKLSHLLALDPKFTGAIIKMAGKDTGKKPQDAVTHKLLGNVGYIKVKSFLVPSITLKQVKNAKEKTSKADFMIYDLRGNGGGSISSVSYLIDSLLGPNKTILYSRSRKSREYSTPFKQYGYFKDHINNGSIKDIEIEKKKVYVEWLTSPHTVKDNRPAVIIVNEKCISSCDIFTAAIKEHKAARIVGTRTGGEVIGAILYKLWWPGYSAIMPVNEVISPNGILYEGVGIEPDIVENSCNNVNSARCLERAINELTTK